MEEKLTNEQRKKVTDALLRRACGYRTSESTEEYSAGEDGEPVFVRRRDTEKEVPCDVAAARLLLEESGGDSGGYSGLSDEKLISLCRELVKSLGL